MASTDEEQARAKSNDASERKPAGDAVEHPPHYTRGRFETIDVIEDWQLNFHLGNAVKYISRAGHKDPSKTVEDLKKARWYLDRHISQLEGEPAPQRPSPTLDECKAKFERELGEAWPPSLPPAPVVEGPHAIIDFDVSDADEELTRG